MYWSIRKCAVVGIVWILGVGVVVGIIAFTAYRAQRNDDVTRQKCYASVNSPDPVSRVLQIQACGRP